MKRLLVCLLSALVLICSAVIFAVTKQKTDRETDDLAGPVKEWVSVEYAYDSASRSMDASNGVKMVFAYDKSGKKTSERYFSLDGKELGRYRYKKDNRGNVLEQVWLDRKGEPSMDRNGIVKLVCRFDKNNFLVEKAYYGPNDMLGTKYQYLYNEKGLCAEQKVFSSYNALEERDVYIYGPGDVLLMETDIDADGRTNGVVRYSFTNDRFSNTALEERRDAAEKLLTILRYYRDYDPSGNVTDCREYRTDFTSDGTNTAFDAWTTNTYQYW